MCAVLRKPKSVKLRALHSECKFGVAARSCQELLHKGCVRFQLPVSGSRLCLYEDGTEVTDDSLPGLPNDAELLLLTAGQTWQGYVSDITRFLSVFNEQHAGVIRATQQLLSHEGDPLRQKLLADLLHHVNQNITAETREQDPSWFEGLESRFRNKSGYLRYSCESRIRGYLRETRMPVRCRVEGRPSMVDGTYPYREHEVLREHEVPLILPDLEPDCPDCSLVAMDTASLPRPAGLRISTGHALGLPSQAAAALPVLNYLLAALHTGSEVSAHTSAVDAAAREEFERVLSSMCQKLKSQKYNGSYFDRGAEASERLCTAEGWFSCQGPFDLESCLSKHSINPYGNRESRILFSTWNLDHIIEKKRTVVPTLAEAVQDGREVNWEYFYSLLFTAKNLKLVHIACHKKTTHKLQCDRSKIYRPQAGSKKKRPARKRPPVTHARPSEVMQW